MRCTVASPILILASVVFGKEDTLTAVEVFEKVAPSVIFVTNFQKDLWG